MLVLLKKHLPSEFTLRNKIPRHGRTRQREARPGHTDKLNVVNLLVKNKLKKIFSRLRQGHMQTQGNEKERGLKKSKYRKVTSNDTKTAIKLTFALSLSVTAQWPKLFFLS